MKKNPMESKKAMGPKIQVRILGLGQKIVLIATDKKYIAKRKQ